MYTFYINGTAVSDPLEWSEFTETLEYDDQVHGILMKYNQKFTFVKDGYELISNTYATGGYCQQLELKVVHRCSDSSSELVLDGRIFLSEAKFNRSKCTVEVEFEDNSFTAKIFANRNVKAYINADRSKNGTSITPATKFPLLMFDPFGVAAGFYRDVYDLYDAFRYLVDFMTDGTVGFASDYLSNLDDDKNIAITSATLLRLTAPVQYEPNISFLDLFEETRKKLNIAFSLEKDSIGNPVIRIENFDYYKSTAGQSAIVSYIPELMESFNSDYYYSSVKIGSNAVPYKPLQHALAPIPFITHQDEDYPIQSECNTDEELDLKSRFIIDSNLIQGLVLSDTANDDYDKDHAFIQYTKTTVAATKWNTIDISLYPNKWYYNEIFTNSFVSDNFNLQGDLAKYLGVAVPMFYATKTTDEALQSYTGTVVGQTFIDVYTDLEFANDSIPPGQDPGGNYDNTTYRFTAPASGLYSFEQQINVAVTNSTRYVKTGIFDLNDAYWTVDYVYLEFLKYDAGGTLITSYTNAITFSPFYNPPIGQRLFKGSSSIFLNAGEKVSVQVRINGKYNSTTPFVSGYQLDYYLNKSNSYFKMVMANTGGGIYGNSKDARMYFSSIFEFEQVLTEAEWSAIKLNPAYYMQFSMSNANYKSGWIKRLERNKQSGLTKFTLISNLDNI